MPRSESQTSSNKPKIIFLVGPTAVGKSEVSIYLARKIKGEIISCDSMQIYKGMDIITSKPYASVLKRTPHHLISVIPADKEYNVSRYRKDALKKVINILKRGRVPVLVGGTGLYMSILIDGIFEQSVQDDTFRKKMYALSAKNGSPYLHSRLKEIDPDSAKRIHPNDAKRIIRALEVYEATGKPISVLQKERRGLKDDFDVRVFCLNMQRDKLYKRIDERVDRMFRQGLVDEVKRLSRKRLSKTASCAIGIKELSGYLEGAYDLEEARRLMQRNSRRYAKRQLTWFRKDKRIKWINIKYEDRPQEIAARIWKILS
jgi:tRNA dimethylallyltransferase